MRAATPKTTHAVTEPKSVAAKAQKAAVAPSQAMKQAAMDAARAKPATPAMEKSHKKAKIVRDRFSMPEDDYGKLVELKSKCLAAGMPVKKSELLRMGLHFLETLPIARLKAAVARLESVKTDHKAVRKAAKHGKPAKLH